MRIAVLVLGASLSCACGHGPAETDVAATENDSHATPEHAATETHASVGDTHATLPPVPPGDRRLDARGLDVTRHADGTITVAGTDRWGSHIDITYADGHYFKYAVATLARSVSDEQAQALRDTIPELAPEAVNDNSPPVPAGSAPTPHP